MHVSIVSTMSFNIYKGYHVSKCIIRHVIILLILDYASLEPTFP